VRLNRRDPVDLGSGLVREYFPERTSHRAPRQEPKPAEHRGAIDKREADPRKALASHVEPGRVGYAALSRMLGRADHYLWRFVRHGSPRALQPDDHRRLADFFGVDERALGVRDLWHG
jgi:hypothetical protein